TLQNEKISEYVKTGEMTYFNKLKSEYPETLTELLKIDGLGPKRIKSLYDVLGIADIESLEKSCISGSLKEQKGFTEQGVGKILDSVKQFKSNDKYKIRNVDFDNIR
ncbi:MAG: helix-hairpin-helix domain-containing protein, partial [Candidatus Kapaibacterium sp.]